MFTLSLSLSLSLLASQPNECPIGGRRSNELTHSISMQLRHGGIVLPRRPYNQDSKQSLKFSALLSCAERNLLRDTRKMLNIE